MNLVRFNSSADRFYNNWLNDFGWEETCVANANPTSKVVEHDDRFEIMIAVPGLTKSDISIKIEKNVLKIAGKEENSVENDFVNRSFKKAYRLGSNIDAKKVVAKLENGILKQKKKKKENEAPVAIDIDVK